jgi:two-component system LytT family sensor kinase
LSFSLGKFNKTRLAPIKKTATLAVMSKNREIVFHVIFWCCFIILDQLLENLMRNNKVDLFWNAMQTIEFSLLQMLVFYLNYLWICPKTIPRRKWGWLILAQAVLLLLFPALRFLCEEVFIFYLAGFHNYSFEQLSVSYYLYDNSYFVIRIILFSVVGYFLKYLWNTSSQMNQLQLEKKQAELLALKNQFSPHFLFNALNSFYSDLYDSNPKMALDILKLSEMLRYVTYEMKNDMALLKDEVHFLQNYIDLFRRRFDDKVAIQFSYPQTIESYRITSLVLIHFLENAFKHGVSDDFDNPIVMAMHIDDGRFIFTLNNKCRNVESYDEKGIGNNNIIQRLSILYRDNYTLNIKQGKDYQVTLNIPLS